MWQKIRKKCKKKREKYLLKIIIFNSCEPLIVKIEMGNASQFCHKYLHPLHPFSATNPGLCHQASSLRKKAQTSLSSASHSFPGGHQSLPQPVKAYNLSRISRVFVLRLNPNFLQNLTCTYVVTQAIQRGFSVLFQFF